MSNASTAKHKGMYYKQEAPGTTKRTEGKRYRQGKESKGRPRF